MKSVCTLFAIELFIELRSLSRMIMALFFSLLVVVLGAIAWGATPESPELSVTALTWLAGLFALTLFMSHRDNASHYSAWQQTVLLRGVAAETIFISKVGFFWFHTCLILVSTYLVASLLFHAPITHFFPMCALFAVTGLGLATLGSLIQAILMHAHLNRLMPLLFFPLITPLVIPAVYATRQLLVSGSSGLFGLLFGLSILYLGISFLLAEYVIDSE